jgi:hypothetical protein
LRISKKELFAFLVERLNGRPVTKPATDIIPNDDIISLNMDSRLLRCGGEVRLVVPCASPQALSRTVPALVKAVARAYGWYERILQGKALHQRTIAEQTGLNERYVHRILGCAFLAPDIIEAILCGRQPHDLTLEKLQRKLPMVWDEQRKLLGFAS